MLKALRANPETAHPRVLVLSNSSKQLEMQEAIALGIAGYWIKAAIAFRRCWNPRSSRP